MERVMLPTRRKRATAKVWVTTEVKTARETDADANFDCDVLFVWVRELERERSADRRRSWCTRLRDASPLPARSPGVSSATNRSSDMGADEKLGFSRRAATIGYEQDSSHASGTQVVKTMADGTTSHNAATVNLKGITAVPTLPLVASQTRSDRKKEEQEITTTNGIHH
jgi:hypothetical protein